MSFFITIIKRPRTKAGRLAAEAEGFIDLPELNVMVGEHGGIEGIGEFIWDPAWVQEECQSQNFDGALNDSISGEAREILIELVREALPKKVGCRCHPQDPCDCGRPNLLAEVLKTKEAE